MTPWSCVDDSVCVLSACWDYRASSCFRRLRWRSAIVR